MLSYMPQDRETFTDVLTYNLTAGFEGKIPGTDWTWEAFVTHGESSTFARQTGIYSLERTQTVLSSPAFGAGFNVKGNAESGGFGASTGTCTSGLNFYNPPVGGYSNNCLEAISADLKNRSKMRQTIAEVNLQGGLFDLPAGQLRFALGASYRELKYEFINDTLTTQGRSFLDQALGIYPSGNAFGFIRVKELYGELLVPILKDIPFIQELNLEIGGRISNYNTTGTSYTYKILGDWEATPWLRFRGGYNRAERAPNIGELFLAASQTFAGDNAGDVCSRGNPNTFSANPLRNSGGAAGATAVEAACRVLMLASGNPQAPTTYYAATQSTAGGGFAFPTTVGNPNLIPEKADTWTAGVVIQSPLSSGPLSRLRLSVDWYDITIKDAIGVQNPGAISRACFDTAFNPAIAGGNYDPVTGTPNAAAFAAVAGSQYCQLLNRTQTGNTGNVLTTYSNTGFVHLSGIDTQLDWSYKVGPGMLSLNTLLNYQLKFESSALYPQIAPVDYVGTTGTGDNGLNQGTFEYRLLTTDGYSVGPFRASLQWQYYPKLEDSGQATTTGGTPNVAPYPAYSLFNLSGTWQLTDDIGLRLGVDNLLNQAPPLGGFNPNIPTGTYCTATTAQCTIGSTRGGAYNGQFYDTNGRRFYVGANVRF
jgi:outer membrane receptor protein involved in Fe transport